LCVCMSVYVCLCLHVLACAQMGEKPLRLSSVRPRCQHCGMAWLRPSFYFTRFRTILLSSTIIFTYVCACVLVSVCVEALGMGSDGSALRGSAGSDDGRASALLGSMLHGSGFRGSGTGTEEGDRESNPLPVGAVAAAGVCACMCVYLLV